MTDTQIYGYSASEDKFYSYQSDNIVLARSGYPDDLVDVDSNVYFEMGVDAAPPGKHRGGDSEGHPCWLDDVVGEPAAKQQDQEHHD